MGKKEFIALADALRERKPTVGHTTQSDYGKGYDYGRLSKWHAIVEHLSDFCASQNPRFNKVRWIDYIVGECGSNGGRVKK